MRKNLKVVLLSLAAIAALLALALVHKQPGDFAFKWYWSNNGVGNYVADLTVAVLAARKLLKEWKAHRAHQTAILEHLDVLHRHHKIGKYASNT